MKHIKYIIFLLLLVLLGNFTKADPIQLRIPDSTAAIGDFIDIPVYVDSSLTGEEVFSYQLQLSYYPNCLNFISVEIAGTIVESWGSPAVNGSSPGYINVAGAGVTALSGTGVLFYMRFECLQSCGVWISFYGGTAVNFFNEGTPELILDNGYLSISGLPVINVYPDNGLLFVGDQLQFYVSGGTAPYQWYVTDPSVASIDAAGLLSANSYGFTRVVAEDDTGVRDTTTGFVEVRAIELSIPDTSAWQGSTIDIPVYTSDLSGLDICSGNFSLSFSQNILTATTCITAGTMLDGWGVISFNNTHPGEVHIAFAGTTSLNGGGVLLYIRFDVSAINTGASWISFSDVLFNEELLAITDNGYFSTINYSTIYVTPGGSHTLVAGETLQFGASGGVPPYSWSSSNISVATIDATGLLTAHHSGVIQVTATDDVGATGLSGNITIYDTYVTIPNVNATVNSQYDLPVLISDMPVGQSVSAIEGTISFRTPELEAIDIITAGTMSSGWTAVEVISGNEITFALAGTTNFNTPGAMFKIRFQLTPDLTPGENAWVHIDNIMLNEGIPLPQTENGSITAKNGIIVSLIANLEGPFNGSDMNTTLNPDFLPKHQPYNVLPWNYNGSEYVNPIPNTKVVDWLLVELRETPGDAATATSSTIIDRQACFVLEDGKVVRIDGQRNLVFDVTINDNLFAVILHRNHIGIMSAMPLLLQGGIYSYDFTSGPGQVHGGTIGHKELNSGIWGMIAADSNADGLIDILDKVNIWESQAGNEGYNSGDFNLDGHVNNPDKNDYWLLNVNFESQVPD